MEQEKRGHHVLIIEDHPEQAHLMQLILNRAQKNFSVHIVHEAEAGLEAEEGRPALAGQDVDRAALVDYPRRAGLGRLSPRNAVCYSAESSQG